MSQSQLTNEKIVYEFGPFRFDTSNCWLWEGEEKKRLSPIQCKFLLVLIQGRGNIVKTEDIKTEVWGYVFKGYRINHYTKKLRDILGDDDATPKYIFTHDRIGLEFIANVREIREPVLSGPVEATREVPSSGPLPDNIHRDSNVGSEKPGVHSPATIPFSPIIDNRLTACGMYSGLYAIALLTEVAYQFDVYGVTGLGVAFLVFCWIFITSLIGMRILREGTLEGKPKTLAGVLLILAFSALVAVLAGNLFLPAEAVTEADGIQTYPAQAAYVKTIFYYVPLVIIYLIVPYQFVVAMQREIRLGKNKEVISLLEIGDSDSWLKRPIYLRVKHLTVLLILTAFVSFIFVHYLFVKLRASPNKNWFMFMVYARFFLYFAFGGECLYWYSHALNELKRFAVFSDRRNSVDVERRES